MSDLKLCPKCGSIAYFNTYFQKYMCSCGHMWKEKQPVSTETLDNKEAKYLFRDIIELSCQVAKLAFAVQNPNSITKENAKSNYDIFHHSYLNIRNKLNEIDSRMCDIHQKLIQSKGEYNNEYFSD